MKKTFLSLILIAVASLCINSINAQTTTIKSKVDERSELLSIIFRLIGAEEYSKGAIMSYNNDIDTYFANIKDHEVLKLAKEYRNEFGVGYDAVMFAAAHININGSSIKLNEDVYNNMGEIWNKERLELFVEKLSDFYKKTKFNDFFKSHDGLYSSAEQIMNDILETKMDFTWFNRFFGEDKGDDFNVIINLVNGPSNYAAKNIDKDGKEKIYAIIGTGSADGITPSFPAGNTVFLIVHEICHSYCNHLINKHFKDLEKSGEIIFPHIAKKMESQAYGSWKIVLYEALVRASVICYADEEKTINFNINNLINYERGCGFFWIKSLTRSLKSYETNRSEYSDLDSYMPQIITFYNELAAKVEKQAELFPKVISSSIENNSKVPYTTSELIFKFNKSMDTKKGYGFNHGKGGKDLFPKIDKIEWIDDKTIKLTLNLEQGKKYSLQLYTSAYADAEGFPVMENYHLEFETE